MVKVIKAFKLKPDCHCTSKYLNNLIEQDHRHIKVRKTRYQSINTAKNTLKGIEVHTEDSFLLKLYYKFNFATEPDILYRAFSLKKLHIS
uniref:IS431mec, transposase n=1 Tax=Staphylococcus aureus subsp. aureus GR1 TaxID=1144272 RepID=X5IXK7_STAAU|nr:IS431mec, transposase [Staphylococcus aureus subsp. aureus GR1]